MKMTLNKNDIRALNAQTRRARASRALFPNDSAWLKATLTRYCGAYPEALDAQVTQICALCNDAAESLHEAQCDSMQRDNVLTEKQWQRILSTADSLNPLADEHAQEHIGQLVEEMIGSLSRTERERQFCRLYALTNREEFDPDELAAMPPQKLTAELVRMTDAYVKNELSEKNLPATLRFAHGGNTGSFSPEKKAEREATVRALTAILASKPAYRSQLSSGALKMETIASAAYAVVETGELTQALPETDWAEVVLYGAGAVFSAIITAFLIWFAIELASGEALVLGILGAYTLLYAALFGSCLKHIVNELCPAGVMQTEAVCQARHALAKVTTAGGNLLRDARCALMNEPAPEHKVVVEAPRVRVAPANA